MSLRAHAVRFALLSSTLCALSPLACKRKADTVSRDVLVHADLTTDASTTDAATVASAFSLVARASGTVELQRIENSPVLGSMRGAGYAFVLSPDGSVAPLEPNSTHHAEIHDGTGWDIGRIAGVWPNAVYVEMAIAGGRSETVIESFLLDVEKKTLAPKRFNGHLAFARTWSDGRLLGWTGESSSVMGPFAVRRGRFELLAGPRPPAMPVWPKKAASIAGDFVAYESGRIFALAGLEVGEGEWERNHIWDFADGVHAKPVKLRGEARALARGRNEREALVVGTLGEKRLAYLARFDGSEWAEVKLPFEEVPISLSTGDDGSVWIVSGEPGWGDRPSQPSRLWRADFPELRFERVPVDPWLVMTSVMARNASDVWLVAATGQELRTSLLLHTQAPKEVEEFGFSDDPQRVMLSKKEPPPYFAGCVVPFVMLGREEDVSEQEVIALRASLKDWPYNDDGVLVRVQSGKVYGFELHTSVDSKTPARYRTPAATVATVKAKHPAAKLVCTRGLLEKSLDAPPKP